MIINIWLFCQIADDDFGRCVLCDSIARIQRLFEVLNRTIKYLFDYCLYHRRYQ